MHAEAKGGIKAQSVEPSSIVSELESEQCRQFLGKLAEVVAANMADLAAQRTEQAAAGSGKQAVFELEKRLAQLEAATVVEPYTGEDLKEALKAAEVS